MIIWFTGQPGAGKSTLAKAVAAALNQRGHKTGEIDGEDLRRQTGNTDYSDAGRILNVRIAQQRAAELAASGCTVLASFVSPHRWLREEFKAREKVVEVYLHTPNPTDRDHFRVPNYEPPLAQFIDLDTSSLSVEQCVETILNAISRI